MNHPEPGRKPFNPWPVGIIAFFALAICAAVTFIIFCQRNQVDLVATDYYEQELRYQKQMDSIQRAASLPAPARVEYDQLARRITVSLPPEHLGGNLRGWIELYRPSAAELDQKFPLQTDAGGAQVIDASKLADGLWHIRISWNTHGADYYHDQTLVVGQKST
jgi:hypothetical protein